MKTLLLLGLFTFDPFVVDELTLEPEQMFNVTDAAMDCDPPMIDFKVTWKKQYGEFERNLMKEDKPSLLKKLKFWTIK